MIRIPKNTTIVGELRSSGEVRIDGHFEGEGIINGTLILTETCVWVGNIVADIVVIEGIVEGDIIAHKKLLVAKHAKIRGNIKTPALDITYGAKLRCRINMLKPGKPVGLLEHRPPAIAEEQEFKLAEQSRRKSA